LPAILTDLLQTPGLRTSQFKPDVTTICFKELHHLVRTSPFQELKAPCLSPFIIFSQKCLSSHYYWALTAVALFYFMFYSQVSYLKIQEMGGQLS